MQSAVLEQVRIDVFSNYRIYFLKNRKDQEMDHLSCLLEKVSSSLLNIRVKSYGKTYSEMVGDKNEPSLRHQLTKTILFNNQ